MCSARCKYDCTGEGRTHSVLVDGVFPAVVVRKAVWNDTDLFPGARLRPGLRRDDVCRRTSELNPWNERMP